MADKKDDRKTVTANDAMSIRHLEKSLATQHLRNALRETANQTAKEENKPEPLSPKEGNGK